MRRVVLIYLHYNTSYFIAVQLDYPLHRREKSSFIATISEIDCDLLNK